MSIPPGSTAGHPSSAPPRHISVYDCDLIWGSYSDTAVLGLPEECIFTIVKSVLFCMGVPGPENSLGSIAGGALRAVSPIVTHLLEDIKDKVWRRKFYDFLALVPPDREVVDKSCLVDFTAQGDKSKQLPWKFGNWLQGFCAYAGVLCQQFPELAAFLFCYLECL